MHCEDQIALLHKIQEMSFVAFDLHLYLDTHPCDKDALNDYNCAVEMVKKYLKEYEAKYGSLMTGGYHGDEKWNWICSPWPWEM